MCGLSITAHRMTLEYNQKQKAAFWREVAEVEDN